MSSSKTKKFNFGRIGNEPLWKNMRIASFIIFLIAVFFLFAPVGFITDIWSGGTSSTFHVFLVAFYSGIVAIGYASSFTRKISLLPFVILFQFGFFFIGWNKILPMHMHEHFFDRAVFDSIGIFISIIIAYIFMVIFVNREGIHRMRLQAEMEIAGDIHRLLVPDIDVKGIDFIIYGKSSATEEVGGDLIDYLQTDSKHLAILSDVSGHGVGPGLLMGMFKAALRDAVEDVEELSNLLTRINRILFPLKKRNMFITVAAVWWEDDRVEFSTVGHLPIIHYQKNNNAIVQHHIQQLPIGTRIDRQIQSGSFQFLSGDLVILLSDGLTETRNKKKEEFGDERLLELVKKNVDKTPNDIASLLFDEVSRFGKSLDDQSVLIIKKS